MTRAVKGSQEREAGGELVEVSSQTSGSAPIQVQYLSKPTRAERVAALRAEARAFRSAARYALTWRGQSSIDYLSRYILSRFGEGIVRAFSKRVDSWGPQDASFAASPDDAWDNNGIAFLFLALECESEADELTPKHAPTTKRSSPVRTSRKGGR